MQITLYNPQQCESMVDLLCELYSFYNDKPSVTREVVQSHLLNNLLATDTPLRLVVATNDNQEVVGFAAIILIYSLVDPTPDHRRQCQVKEMFVSSSDRGKGIGRRLMKWVAEYATDQGCGRIDWNVKNSNQKGIAFYKSLGAEQIIERLNFRLSRSNMIQLTSEREK